MTLVVPFFFAHQPFRLRAVESRLASGPLAPDHFNAHFFDESHSRELFLRTVNRSYRPATRLMLDLVQKHAGREKPFRVAYGLSGTMLAQAKAYAPDLLDLWKAMANTGLVEFTGETSHHSLACLFDEARVEFREQAALHRGMIQDLFGQTPRVFCNTGMLYNNALAACVQEMGYQGVLTEGVDWLMAGWRSPDYVYAAPCRLPILLRNYRLSDDIGFRFSDPTWDGYPLTPEKFAGWLAGSAGPCVLLAMDYEVLGEQMTAETGIFDFLAALPEQAAHFPALEWATPSQVVARVSPAGQIDVPDYATISWADRERDTSAWLGNEMQQFCYEELKRLEPAVRATGSAEWREVWRRMQASDHLRAISSKGDGSESSYSAVVEAFHRLQAAVYELKRRMEQEKPPRPNSGEPEKDNGRESRQRQDEFPSGSPELGFYWGGRGGFLP